MFFENGSKYEGDFFKGNINGEGHYIWAKNSKLDNSSNSYCGEW